jgi:hypothetical protein
MLKRLNRAHLPQGEIFIDQNGNCFYDAFSLVPMNCFNGHNQILKFESVFFENKFYCRDCDGDGLKEKWLEV